MTQDQHQAKESRWRCGKCDGAKVPMHSPHCLKRLTEDDPAEVRRLSILRGIGM